MMINKISNQPEFLSLNINMRNYDSESQMLGNMLKEVATEVLQIFKKSGEKVADLQIVYSSPNIRQGKNFIGPYDGEAVCGTALYFERKANSYQLFIGKLSVGGQPIRKGIRIELSFSNINPNQISFSRFSALLLYDWQAAPRQGYYICKNGKKQTHFKGVFNPDSSMKQGVLWQKQSGALICKYDGTFSKNEFDGKGKINVPGQYEYEGEFKFNNKEGIGRESDIVRKTTYVGNFVDNEKDGYGEIIYDDGKSLKGFWKKGVMANEDGVFIDEKGDPIQIYDKRYIPII